MIYTLTLNPAIDYFLSYDKEIIDVQKTSDFRFQIGGKGINASKVLNELNIDNRAIILSGGINGSKLEQLLTSEKIKYININSGVETRINVKANFNGRTYEQNSTGEEVLLKDVQQLLMKTISDNLNKGDTILIMGSLPLGYSFNELEEICMLASEKEIKMVFDLSKDHMIKLVKYRPEVIKPNMKELGEMFNTKITTVDEAKKYAGKLLSSGAKRVIVSFDKTGSIYLDENNLIEIDGVRIKEVNGSGAGDSMIAAFVAGLEKELDIFDVIKLASGAGTATAASEGIADVDKINFYADKIKIKGEKNV